MNLIILVLLCLALALPAFCCVAMGGLLQAVGIIAIIGWAYLTWLVADEYLYCRSCDDEENP